MALMIGRNWFSYLVYILVHQEARLLNRDQRPSHCHGADRLVGFLFLQPDETQHSVGREELLSLSAPKRLVLPHLAGDPNPVRTVWQRAVEHPCRFFLRSISQQLQTRQALGNQYRLAYLQRHPSQTFLTDPET